MVSKRRGFTLAYETSESIETVKPVIYQNINCRARTEQEQSQNKARVHTLRKSGKCSVLALFCLNGDKIIIVIYERACLGDPCPRSK